MQINWKPSPDDPTLQVHLKRQELARLKAGKKSQSDSWNSIPGDIDTLRAEEPMSDYWNSVPGNVNAIIEWDDRKSNPLGDDGFPDTQTEEDENLLLSKYQFDREALVSGLSKLILLKNSIGGISFMTLTYEGKSKNNEKLMRFNDGRYKFYWNGEQFNGRHIALQKYVVENGDPKYPECDLDVLINEIKITP